MGKSKFIPPHHPRFDSTYIHESVSDQGPPTNQIPRHCYRKSGNRVIRSNSLARISFSCTIRRSVRLALARHLWKLIGVISLLTGGIYAKTSRASRRNTEESAKRLASFALDRLATQATLHLEEPSRIPESWISMTQLRDHILRDEFSASKRQKLWQKVQKLVENNSNVRAIVRESRTGEVSRVWEWIGAIGTIEDGRGSDRRRSSRVSFGLLGSSPIGRGDTPSMTRNEKEMGETRKWDEGRPLY